MWIPTIIVLPINAITAPDNNRQVLERFLELFRLFLRQE
jgi:hypothetical protein